MLDAEDKAEETHEKEPIIDEDFIYHQEKFL
jgi:hypothetical protein